MSTASIDGPRQLPMVHQFTDEEKATVMEVMRLTADPVTCPFCKDDDFDLIGLKIHLTRHCTAFDRTPISDAGTPYVE